MRIKVEFREKPIRVQCQVKNGLAMNVKFDSLYGAVSDVETYTGNYLVTPKTEEQILKTNKKLMTNDVTVKKIPYYDVSNESGGSTVFIGSEV